jgi:hypothetical protein
MSNWTMPMTPRPHYSFQIAGPLTPAVTAVPGWNGLEDGSLAALAGSCRS